MNIELRETCQIQMAHDVLTSVIFGETPLIVPEEIEPRLVCALDVLCWVLKHDHNQTFEENLKQLTEQLANEGITFSPRKI
jgi:hypothetical protein